MTVASNSSRDVCKIYGRIVVENITTNGELQFQTNLRPSETINIDGVCLRSLDGSVRNFVTFSIDTSGLVTVPYLTNPQQANCILLFTACMIFLKNFGDTPVNQ